jgi:predicted nuclease of restriction endonuclease-like (RecB) superfamily
VTEKAKSLEELPADYDQLLRSLRVRIRAAQVRAAFAANTELIMLYWSIGREISSRFEVQRWGGKIVDRLSRDLEREFPGVEGFSPRNLRYMRKFAEAWPDSPILQQAAAKLPWGHHMVLLDKVKDGSSREWYLKATLEYGWSRAVLTHQIESDLLGRQGHALSNFSQTLPAVQSDMAQKITKDPYVFDFLTLRAEAQEKELEEGLLKHLRDFLLELGKGFAFVGSQYHLEVGGKDFYLDLLFYHVHLRRWVVIDLKMEDFRPEFSGKMNFYLSAVDDLLRHPGDAESIGLILCKGKNQTVVEYALRDTAKPMSVSEYRVTRQLPEAIQENVPSIEDLEVVVSRLRGELEAAQAELQQYRCPYCQAPLSERVAAEIEIYACGFSTSDGFIERPCPSDPGFPSLSDYSITVAENAGAWICSALPRTPMAQRVSLSVSVGKTEEIARQRMDEQYARVSRRWK